MKSESIVLRHGKTVKIDLALSEDCRVQEVIISGDFFIYPEESLEELEERLKGCGESVCIEDAFKTLESSTLLGVNLEDVKRRIVEIVEKCTGVRRGGAD
uniref:ABC transporter substrate-binding protein n=1 Tax=Thermosphaera aggregans TaxID=54254 RepID=A0A7C2FF87_9CREN